MNAMEARKIAQGAQDAVRKAAYEELSNHHSFNREAVQKLILGRAEQGKRRLVMRCDKLDSRLRKYVDSYMKDMLEICGYGIDVEYENMFDTARYITIRW